MNWYKKAQNFHRNAEIEQIDGKWYVKCRLKFNIKESALPNLSFPNDIKLLNKCAQI